MRWFEVVAAGFAALFSLAAIPSRAAGPSGLPPGEKVPAFQVVDVTGPNKEKASLCYV